MAIQFNYVVGSNAPAVDLYKKLGFAIVGTLPKAFRHKQLGLVDAYVMYRFLQPQTSNNSLRHESRLLDPSNDEK